MKVTPLAIPEVKLLSLDCFEDDRGCFTVHWHAEEFKEAVDGHVFRQDSFVTSVPNVVRGLHYQLPPVAQGKLVRCLEGGIQDVAVDIRRSSPTFGQWVDAFLYADRNEALWIPPGFAHGYASLDWGAKVFYKITEVYSPANERSLLWNDRAIGIAWATKGDSIISTKDQAGIPLNEADVFE
jgi:dTDP-4-dehydrorhamnose 3,5-epimerase